VSIANNVDPAAEKKAARVAERAPADLDMIEKVVDQFLKRHVTKLAKSTQSEVSRIMRKEVLPAFRGRKLSSIGKAEIHLLFDKVADRGAPVTANRALAWFKCMCNFAISRGLITVNPCAGIKPLDETPRARVLSDMEIKALWEAASALPPPYCSFVFMLILTGQSAARWAA
jgi:integrase